MVVEEGGGGGDSEEMKFKEVEDGDADYGRRVEEEEAM